MEGTLCIFRCADNVHCIMVFFVEQRSSQLQGANRGIFMHHWIQQQLIVGLGSVIFLGPVNKTLNSRTSLVKKIPICAGALKKMTFSICKTIIQKQIIYFVINIHASQFSVQLILSSLQLVGQLYIIQYSMALIVNESCSQIGTEYILVKPK